MCVCLFQILLCHYALSNGTTDEPRVVATRSYNNGNGDGDGDNNYCDSGSGEKSDGVIELVMVMEMVNGRW